jgi:hypothetical protein
LGQVAAFVAGSLVGVAAGALADAHAADVRMAGAGCPEGTTECVVCVTTSNDPNNCGACGNVCPTPSHTVATCVDGSCGVVCQQGFADCDGNAANGCETDVTSDVANCGGCGRVCAGANATMACEGSTCVIIACDSGFADCDGITSNGCEAQLANDVNNCGACKNVCNGANATMACQAGTCVVAICGDPGFGDCDGNAANGCETNLRSDVSHCGACNNVCVGANATMVCVNGTCRIGVCDPGFDDCDGTVGNGCETNLRSDVNHCGACDHACTGANATMACQAGTCMIVACDFGFANCDGNAANGCETNIRTDDRNCGGCGLVCGQGQTCVAGVCQS